MSAESSRTEVYSDVSPCTLGCSAASRVGLARCQPIMASILCSHTQSEDGCNVITGVQCPPPDHTAR